MRQSNKYARCLIQQWRVCPHARVFNKSGEKARQDKGDRERE